MTTMEHDVTDSAAIDRLIEEHVNKVPDEPVDTQARVTSEPPSDTSVRLPGGYVDAQGSVHRTAEVRELNGVDEEALLRVDSTGKIMMAMIERATVSIGDIPATREVLEDLLAADREALLLGIRVATYGRTEAFTITCPHCSEQFDHDIDLVEDIPAKTLTDPEIDSQFEVTLRRGTAQVSLPTGRTQKSIAGAQDKTLSELNTILLRGCVQSINGMPVMGEETIKALGLADRSAILTAIADRNPGPRLGDVTVECEACEKVIDTPLSLTALFRL